MRGRADDQGKIFTYFDPESRIPADHPLRALKTFVDRALLRLSAEFDRLYGTTGRPSIPPERLLKGCLLVAFYSIRSDRMFCQMLDYNILFRWFLDMDLEEKTLDQSNFSRLRARLEKTDLAQRFFYEVVGMAKAQHLVSSEHFTVDGTLIEAWASLKSFRPKDGSGKGPGSDGQVDFHGEKRRNDTHQSTTDPESKLMRKGRGKEAKMSYGGHALMENRNGLLVGVEVCDATTAETTVAKTLLEDATARGFDPQSVGADKGYHTKDFVNHLRENGIRPHIAMIAGRKTPGLDGRTTRHNSYQVSQRKRKLVEEIFGWLKSYGGLRKTRFRGIVRNQLAAYIVGAAYNLIRLVNLSKQAA